MKKRFVKTVFFSEIVIFLFFLGCFDLNASKKEKILIEEKLIKEKKPKIFLDDPTRPWLDIQKTDDYFGTGKYKLRDTSKVKKLKELIDQYNKLEKTGISIRRILVPLCDTKLQCNDFNKAKIIKKIKKNCYYSFGLFHAFERSAEKLSILNKTELQMVSLFLDLKKLALEGFSLSQEKLKKWEQKVKELLKPSEEVLLQIENCLVDKKISIKNVINFLSEKQESLNFSKIYENDNEAQEIILAFSKKLGLVLFSMKKTYKNRGEKSADAITDDAYRKDVEDIREALKIARGQTYPIQCWLDLMIDFYMPLAQYSLGKALDKLLNGYEKKYKTVSSIDALKNQLIESGVFNEDNEKELDASIFSRFIGIYKKFFDCCVKNFSQLDNLKKYFVMCGEIDGEAKRILQQEKFVLIRRNVLLKIATEAQQLHNKKVLVGKIFTKNEKIILKNINKTAQRKANYLVNIWFFEKKQISILFSLPKISKVPTKSLHKVKKKDSRIESQFHMVDPYYRFYEPTTEWENGVKNEFVKGLTPRFLLWLEDKDGSAFTSNIAYTIPPAEKFVKIKNGLCLTRVFRQDAVDGKSKKNEFGLVADGLYIYVIGQDKNLYIIPDKNKDDEEKKSKLVVFAKKKYPAIEWDKQWEFYADPYWEPKHDTILQGDNVICAGTITFRDGKIDSITNDSGHYQPDVLHLANGLWVLLEKNENKDTIFTKRALVSVCSALNIYNYDLLTFLKNNPKKDMKVFEMISKPEEKVLIFEKKDNENVFDKTKRWMKSLRGFSKATAIKSFEKYDKEKKIKKKEIKKIEKDEKDLSLLKDFDLK